MSGIYNVGAAVVVWALFSDPTKGTSVDPERVTCLVKPPNRKRFGADVVNDDPGIYSARIELDVPGTWIYAFASDGEFKAREEGRLIVGQPLLAPSP